MKADFYSEIEKAITSLRINTYKENKEESGIVLSRYLYNIEICRALYTPLHFFEICLRNSIDKTLSSFCNNQEWFSIIPLSDSGISKIDEAKKRISDNGKALTHERIVSELSLGFWTAFFSKKYATSAFQSKIIKQTFKYCPKSQKSSSNLQSIMEQIRNVRNRVYHYERICHWNDLEDKHTIILNCIKWMNPSVYELVLKTDVFLQVLGNGEKQFLPTIKENWN